MASQYATLSFKDVGTYQLSFFFFTYKDLFSTSRWHRLRYLRSNVEFSKVDHGSTLNLLLLVGNTALFDSYYSFQMKYY